MVVSRSASGRAGTTLRTASCQQRVDLVIRQDGDTRVTDPAGSLQFDVHLAITLCHSAVADYLQY
jgi:hypothetical protein